jgi:hypothetical protein
MAPCPLLRPSRDKVKQQSQLRKRRRLFLRQNDMPDKVDNESTYLADALREETERGWVGRYIGTSEEEEGHEVWRSTQEKLQLLP